MTDPKNPETEVTIIGKDRKSIEGGNEAPQEVVGDPGLQTMIVTPSKTESSESEPELSFTVEPEQTMIVTPSKTESSKSEPEFSFTVEPEPPPPAEEVVKDEPTAKIPVKHPPAPPKTATEKKGGGAGLVLGIILLLAIGAGGFLYMRQPQQGSGWLQWLPFKSGADQRQESAQNLPAGNRETLPASSAKREGIQTGMPAQAVREIMGEPLRVATVDQMLQWVYSTGTELFIVRFRDDKVFDKGTAPLPSAAENLAAQAPQATTSAQAPQASRTTEVPPLSTSQVLAAGTVTAQAPPQQNSGGLRYDGVQMGMTSQAVRGILSDPADVRKVRQAVEWEYDTGTGYFVVRFQQDKVVFKGMSPYRIPKPAQTAAPATTVPPSSTQVLPGPTAEGAPAPSDYDKITKGMTPEAVTQILGKPSLVKKLRNSLEWEYITAQGTFEVRFRNSQVIFTGMAPQPVKKGAAAN